MPAEGNAFAAWTSAEESLVHDDDIARREGRHERLGKVGQEAFTIDRARCDHFITLATLTRNYDATARQG